ncbi:MAG: DUF1015 family protein [Candidatus Choladocola sp.]|nr:DUF1015 family protein [Candidatus Choladocola sp.]
MANILPFRGVRPTGEYSSRVAALPYDVFSRAEAYTEAAKDRLSFLNIDRPETQFEASVDMYGPEVYRKARELLEKRIEEKILIQDEQKCYYLYELIMNGRSQTGLVACASIDDYIGDVIRKHENTRAEKEADRIRHVDVCSAQTGPIFLAYRKNERIAAVTEKVKREVPIYDFVSDDGITHRCWRIAEKADITEIRAAFLEIERIYIADGHHRAASAVRVGLMRRQAHPDYDGTEEFNSFLSVLFPDEELMIMDYNRVVKDLNDLSETQFLHCAEEKFVIRKCSCAKKPEKKGTIMMYLGDSWYEMTVRESFASDDPVEGLDVSILQRELLAPVLGITDPKKDPRIDFIGGIRGLEELERRVHQDCAVAFAMYPTSITELFAVADAGLLMPPKSTWFEPKLRSGLFIHKIEE